MSPLQRELKAMGINSSEFELVLTDEDILDDEVFADEEE
jgi:hypothetical protein